MLWDPDKQVNYEFFARMHSKLIRVYDNEMTFYITFRYYNILEHNTCGCIINVTILQKSWKSFSLFYLPQKIMYIYECVYMHGCTSMQVPFLLPQQFYVSSYFLCYVNFMHTLLALIETTLRLFHISNSV